MTAHQEIELKLRVDPDRLPAFRKSEWWRGLGRGRRKSLHSIYFDTPDQRLRDENIVLRIRLDGPNVIQTVKMGVEDSNAIVRREWEAIVPDAVPDPSLVIDPVLPPSFRRLSSLDVEPVFEMKITRDIRKLSVEDTAVEVVVDTGTVTSGDRSAQINEIEMELLSGDAAKLFSVARDINETVPTRLHLKTKSDVGFSLADGKRTTWLKAKTPTLDASMTAGSALDAIVFSCLRHLTANDTCARARLHGRGRTSKPDRASPVAFGFQDLRKSAAGPSPGEFVRRDTMACQGNGAGARPGCSPGRTPGAHARCSG